MTGDPNRPPDGPPGGPVPARGLGGLLARGTVWGVGGQVVTLVAAMVATPFVLRRLGPEAYGVLALTNVLIGYLAVADLGMGVASTRFASEAHARGDLRREAGVVWAALGLAAAATLAVALGLLLAAPRAVDILGLPGRLRGAGVAAFRLTALGLVARGVAGVLNTPHLARMRIDLLTLVNSGTGLAQIVLVPVVLATGGGLVGAVGVVVGASVANAALHAAVGCRLLPGLWRPRLEPGLVGPLARFGLSIVVSALVGLALADAEKVLLPRFATVAALGYYAVAFTLARLLSVAPGALSQALLPAFSRLHGPADRGPLGRLYQGALRAVALAVVPMAAVFWVGGGPFLSAWAGPDYGRQSTPAFCVLVAGVAANALAMVPYNLLCASGRADLIARYNLAEVAPYLAAVAVLSHRFGAAGAALAWTLRVFAASGFYALAVRRVLGLPFRPFAPGRASRVGAGAALFVPAVALARWADHPAGAAVALALALAGYAGLLWAAVLEPSERALALRGLSAPAAWLRGGPAGGAEAPA